MWYQRALSIRHKDRKPLHKKALKVGTAASILAQLAGQFSQLQGSDKNCHRSLPQKVKA
jgi:hypothetical protein